MRRNTAGERGAAAQSAEDVSYALTGTRTAQIPPAHPSASPCSAPLSDSCAPLSRSMSATLPLYRYPWHLPALAAPPVRARFSPGRRLVPPSVR
ncbi:hypothetical protein HYPSUDRAFT_210366 [Hypholoma sublateritium FD-334 SS-4]|uniref:Uncharacterized protein n=1 Tax=Hypholoma sublateritium (strain FD-334 SS-4) TaxID=945553 RepID=A0A0D2KDD1_HYPSF|nr:hypothetical protein HYPSUDRAFT_210366 [Hypholoma sublateritium FD-334 SS-4]